MRDDSGHCEAGHENRVRIPGPAVASGNPVISTDTPEGLESLSVEDISGLAGLSPGTRSESDRRKTGMQQWHIGWRSKAFYGTRAGLYVSEVPWWALAITHAMENVDRYILRHRWCSPPEWMHRIPLGRPKRDEDGYVENSRGMPCSRRSTG